MDAAKWPQIKEHLSTLMDLPLERHAEILSSIADLDIRREVERLITAHEQAETFIETPILVEQGVVQHESDRSFVGRRIGNYLIAERIGTGGMGIVYLAERLDSDFQQKVALKIIKRGMDSEAILRRFAFERRILSTLKHPNIAQLIDGGVSENGLPYFVMEYVEGKPLDRYCREHDLPLEQKLDIFRQICSAVDYAHRNLIIHRDLKPTNILVTSEGVPKLLDFGIAKLLSNDDEAVTLTVTAGRVFTPEYASPEQILGKSVTTATDVYSLGVILYEFLSGVRPYEIKGKSLDEIVRDVCETDPAKPSEALTAYKLVKTHGREEDLRPKSRQLQSLRGDLDNIILKALRKDPAERYGSVDKFSEDLLRYSRGLPVLARPQTLRYRFSKYFGRHRAGVLGALIALISLVAGGSVATWQAVEARSQRAKAERRFNEVRGLANSVVFELHDAIKNLPGATPARELLVSRGLMYLDQLSNDAKGDNGLQGELADAYERIGDIQGGLNSANLGQAEKSFESYRKALVIRETLVAAEPENVIFRSRLADSYAKMTDAYWIKTDLAGSLEFSEKAFRLAEALYKENAANTELRFKMAASQSNHARMLAANGRIDEGLRQSRASVKTMEELTQAAPENPTFRRGLLIAYDRLSEILGSAAENYQEMLGFSLKSQEISLKILAEDPASPNFRRSAAVGYFNIGQAYSRLNDFRPALENFEQAIAIIEKLRQEDPQNEEIRQIASAFETEISVVLIKIGKPSEAIGRLNKSLATLNYLAEKSPTDEIVQFRKAMVYEHLGRAYKQLADDAGTPDTGEQHRQACGYFEKANMAYRRFTEVGKLVGEELAAARKVAEEFAQCGPPIHRARRR
jgi:serine/threonine protein kinase/tetratricopeptide (TPR) repeat protein